MLTCFVEWKPQILLGASGNVPESRDFFFGLAITKGPRRNSSCHIGGFSAKNFVISGHSHSNQNCFQHAQWPFSSFQDSQIVNNRFRWISLKASRRAQCNLSKDSKTFLYSCRTAKLHSFSIRASSRLTVSSATCQKFRVASWRSFHNEGKKRKPNEFLEVIF